MSSRSQEVRITARPGPDADICTFTVTGTSGPVLKAPTRLFSSHKEAASSPLANRVFGVNGVVVLKMQGEQMIVTKSGDDGWKVVGKAIGAAIRSHLDSGEPAVELVDDAKLAERVTRALEEEISPGLAGHGGFVTLNDMRDNVAYVTLGGGCQGCAMSQMTLKQSIEVKLRELVPEVVAVEDATDHSGGQKPFYQ